MQKMARQGNQAMAMANNMVPPQGKNLTINVQGAPAQQPMMQPAQQPMVQPAQPMMMNGQPMMMNGQQPKQVM